jgi:hypothetical protein
MMHHGHEVFKRCSISDSLTGSEDFCTEESSSFDTNNNNIECDSNNNVKGFVTSRNSVLQCHFLWEMCVKYLFHRFSS